MSKRVVLIGHCGPDSSYLRSAVTSAARGAQIIVVEDEASLEHALESGADLVLLNRVLDYGFPEQLGAALVARLRGQHPNLKMILVSNYPEAQAEAIANGALPGFGKREIGSPKVKAILSEALEMSVTEKSKP